MANRLKMAIGESIFTLRQRGWSVRRIARELGIHRETVARYLRRGQLRSKPANAPPGPEAAEAGAKPANAPPGKGRPGSGAKPANAPLGSEDGGGESPC